MKPKKIYLNDKGEPISRQRYWQENKKKYKLCIICGKIPAHFSLKSNKFIDRCEECYKRNLEVSFKNNRKRLNKPTTDEKFSYRKKTQNDNKE